MKSTWKLFVSFQNMKYDNLTKSDLYDNDLKKNTSFLSYGLHFWNAIFQNGDIKKLNEVVDKKNMTPLQKAEHCKLKDAKTVLSKL